SAALFLFLSPAHRGLLLRPGFWVMAAIAAACCLPILFWNLDHGWVTLQHVRGLSGLNAPSIRWLGPFVFLGTPCGLLLVIWFIAWLAAMIAHRPWVETDENLRYLWYMSAIMFAVFLGFSFKTGGGEPNWPITAYISGLVLAAGWLSRQLDSPRQW